MPSRGALRSSRWVHRGGARASSARRTTYHRVYNESFAKGGRWFGHWCQQVPSRIRAGILIDGEPTSECDIRACHMRLLCAHAGIELDRDDPYELPGLRRSEVKLAINIMLNAPSWRSARGALRLEMESQHGASARSQADRLRLAVQEAYPALRNFWNSGFGLVLQNLDATICMNVQRRLRRAVMPCLSIHDSFIVQRSRADTVAVITKSLSTPVTTCEKGTARQLDTKCLISQSVFEICLTIWRTKGGLCLPCRSPRWRGGARVQLTLGLA